MQEVLRFHSLYRERVWGSRALEKTFGRTFPVDRLIGESWENVDRPEAQSIVKSGPLTGQTLRAVIESYGSEIWGRHGLPQNAFRFSSSGWTLASG